MKVRNALGRRERWGVIVDGKMYCNRCAIELQQYTKKRMGRDGMSYCARCAERVELEYLAKHTCSVCTRVFRNGESKFVMPSSIYSDNRLPLLQRLVCTDCYKRVASKARDRVSFLSGMYKVRARLSKNIAKELMHRPYEAAE